MLSRLLEQRWPVTAALSDRAVTLRGKHHYLRPEQWNLIEELFQALEPFDGAMVFLSGQQYVTLSALPQLVQSLKKSIQSSAFETAPVKSYQAHVIEQITTRWQELSVFQPESPNTVLVADALDHRFRKLKFLLVDDVLKNWAAKKKARQPNVSEN
ncbi:hypothetical protein ABG768_028001 [Culter alburnus]|uniref:Uncharacterized protein n=1 Tax=Culter alburnus TaxID=194366 RepID=A0AAW2A817_CULAL